VTRLQNWQAWLKLANVNNAIVAGGHRFDHLFVAIQAVKDGLGSSVAPQNLFQIAIANHELACPFPHLNFQGESYFAYFAGGSIDPAMKRFKEWLVREARSQDSELTGPVSVLEHKKHRRSTAAKRESEKNRS
jgi:DNA-binding transcriptional LysR family regulator